MIRKRGKRGQTTIFIIIGILIVVGVALFFVLSGDEEPEQGYSDISKVSPSTFFKDCLKNNVKTTIRKLNYQGGYLENPLNISFKFPNESSYDVSYLCYTSSTYKTCNVMEPLLINHLQEEIKKEFESHSLVRKCWDSLEENYEAADYDFDGSYEGYEVQLKRDNLIIELKEVDLTASRVNETIDINEIKPEFSTKLYNNARVAIDIISQQAEYGSFNEESYMALYPETDITWDFPGKESNKSYITKDTKIYTIENEQTKEKFRFAVRSLVPPEEI